MLRSIILLLVNAALLLTCTKKGKKEEVLSTVSIPDTIVGSKAITDEIAGANYRKRAKEYFLVIKGDTSNFRILIVQGKTDGKVSMNFPKDYFRKSKPYQERLFETQKILTVTSKDFKFDSLNSLYFNRLIYSGDLAVKITQQYEQLFGMKKIIKVEDYVKIGKFLAESQLKTEVNSLLEPYSLSLTKVSVEKCFFTTKQELYSSSEILTDSAEVPKKILDGIIYIELQTKKN